MLYKVNDLIKLRTGKVDSGGKIRDFPTESQKQMGMNELAIGRRKLLKTPEWKKSYINREWQRALEAPYIRKFLLSLPVLSWDCGFIIIWLKLMRTFKTLSSLVIIFPVLIKLCSVLLHQRDYKRKNPRSFCFAYSIFLRVLRGEHQVMIMAESKLSGLGPDGSFLK